MAGNPSDSLKDQTTSVLEDLEALLQLQGMNREDIVKVDVLLDWSANVEQMNGAYREFFKGNISLSLSLSLSLYLSISLSLSL